VTRQSVLPIFSGSTAVSTRASFEAGVLSTAKATIECEIGAAKGAAGGLAAGASMKEPGAARAVVLGTSEPVPLALLAS
jgi:hypothetical protein